MTEPENFLKRWSKRKLAERERSKDEHAANQHPPVEHDASATDPLQTDGIAKTSNETFDLADLPPIDSIAANTDVTAFLRPGVPPDLTRAALRRAWTSDPAIRDFVGLVESGWDFNNPTAMAGFGAITADEVAQLASKIIGDPIKANSDAPPANSVEQRPAPAQNPPLEAGRSKVADATKAGGNEEEEEENDAPQQDDASS
jgi:hypothetical protein